MTTTFKQEKFTKRGYEIQLKTKTFRKDTAIISKLLEGWIVNSQRVQAKINEYLRKMVTFSTL